MYRVKMYLWGFILIICMIQRIQSIYLLVVSLVSGGLVFVFDFWKNENNQSVNMISLINNSDYFSLGIVTAFLLIALLAFVSLVSFKKRLIQINLNRINILINLILFGFLVYHLLNISGEISFSEKGIGSFLPLGSIVLLLLANRSIRKDENLVKSVDRLR